MKPPGSLTEVLFKATLLLEPDMLILPDMYISPLFCADITVEPMMHISAHTIAILFMLKLLIG